MGGLEEKLSVPRQTRKLRGIARTEQKYERYAHSLSRGYFPPGLLFEFSKKAGKGALKAASLTAIGIMGLILTNYAPTQMQHKPFKYVAQQVHQIADIPLLPDSLETYTHSVRIVDKDRKTIKSFGKRIIDNDIPHKVKQGLLACEDQLYMKHENNPWHVNTFLVHEGVSWYNLAGATLSMINGYTRGGSTIVMQNAKKLLHNDDRTILNKLEEIVYSYNLVSKFGKERNLSFYINTVPLGNNIYGFPAATRNYFGHDLQTTNLQQVVTLGSTIPNHNRIRAFYQIVNGKELDELSPSLRSHAQAGINKINHALAHLHSLEEITDEEMDKWRIKNERDIRAIGFKEFTDPLYGEEEWSTWNIIRAVTQNTYTIDGREVSGRDLLLKEEGDFVINTDIDLELTDQIKEITQKFLHSEEYEKTLRRRNKHSWLKDKKRYQDPPYKDFDEFIQYMKEHTNIGIIAIDKEGDIISYIGSNQFRKNGITIDMMNKEATIQPGSTIKPVTAYYAMAYAGMSPSSTFEDRPLEFKFVESEGRSLWLPRNWYHYSSKRPLGEEYTLREAQILSVNTIFARLYTKDIIRNSMLAGFEKIGLEYDRNDARYWPFGIGASSVPVQDWLGIYTAFLDGYFKEPSFITSITHNNKTIHTKDDRHTLLFQDEHARQNELDILYGVCNHGSGKSMRSEFKQHTNLVSGKTGTESKQRTSLFVSHFNPYYDRAAHPEETMTMMVVFTTDTGGYKRVGMSTEGPTKIAGQIYKELFFDELRQESQSIVEEAKKTNPDLKENHLYLANVNDFLDQALNDRHDGSYINKHIFGVDGYTTLLRQLLHPKNEIYMGKTKEFQTLLDFYCQEKRLIK
ncbi:MAG: transglycosylase domain-containing protein [Nanobdellota archaeon]